MRARLCVGEHTRARMSKDFQTAAMGELISEVNSRGMMGVDSKCWSVRGAARRFSGNLIL